MRRVKFPNYIQNLPSNIIIEYLNDNDSPKIFTNSVYEKIVSKFYEKEYISQILANISDELKNEIFQIYLCGNLGKKISTDEMKFDLLKTFLVFEGVNENYGKLFGFPDFSHNLAEIFAENLTVQNKKNSPQMFFGTFLNDFAIILDMFQNGESKIRTNGEYSQRWLDLLKERCGIGKLITDFDDLSKILDFVINFSSSLGAKFLRENSKIILLSNSNDLLEKVINKSCDLSKIINKYSQTIDYSFLKKLVLSGKNTENWVEIPAEIDFSLKLFHWCGLLMFADKNCFKIKNENEHHFQLGHVLPDFSVYIPIESNPIHLRKLLYSAKITSVDVIYHGKIDKKRVEESLAGGVNEKDIIEVLKIWNAPISLTQTVSEWINSFNRAFVDLPYIAFRNDIAGNISNYSDLQGKLFPCDNYTFFRVKPGEENSVYNILQKFGFDLRKTTEKLLFPLEDEILDNTKTAEFNKNPQFPDKNNDYVFVRQAN